MGNRECMNPKQFLIIGGGVLILVGVLGMVGVTGPTASNSIFGAAWWFDAYENWAHLLLGIVGVIAAFIFPASLQKPLVLLLGVVGLFFAVYSGFVDTNFLGANLENPADTVLHLAVGAWALWAGMQKQQMMTA